VVEAIVTDCPIKNTISSRERNETAFANLPEAISNISEIVDKIEIFDLAREFYFQNLKSVEFNNPEDAVDGGVRGENAYLRHLTFGAKALYQY
jgi:DNA polymerase-3 subunit alpha